MKTYFREAGNRNQEITAQERIVEGQPPASKCTLPIINFQDRNAEFWGDHALFPRIQYLFLPRNAVWQARFMIYAKSTSLHP